MEDPAKRFALSERLQRYVGWSEQDAQRVRTFAPLITAELDPLIDDFYQAISREPEALRVITEGETQIERLKVTLKHWLTEVLSCDHSPEAVERRWRVGRKHVQIGLSQVYVNVALSRLRTGMIQCLRAKWRGEEQQRAECELSLNRLLDLDLAIIDAAYQAELVKREREIERLRRLTEQRRAERLEMAVGYLLEESLHEIYVFDAETLNFIRVNRGARENLGYAMDELREMTPLDIKPEFTESQFRELLEPLKSRRVRNSEFRARHQRRDGTFYDVEVHLQLSELETPPVFVAMILDVTQRKQEEERQLQAERLAAIGQTMAGLAHESRNAFQRIQACLDVLVLELEGQSEGLDLVERVQEALDYIHRLHEDVRDYAAPIRLERDPCDLADIWREAWRNVLEVGDRRGRYRLAEPPDGVPTNCVADRFQLGQVFRNLFENAISQMVDGGEVRVECGETLLAGRPAIEVFVRDEGEGVAEEARERLFAPFFTTKTRGAGLGLAISKRILLAHEGQIELVESDAGATFRIVLPR